MVLIWLVPIDAIELPIPLPVDSSPDRLLLIVLAGATLVFLATDPRNATSRPAGGISLALLAFGTVALASIAMNADNLASLGDLGLGVKQFAILLSFAALFFVVATVIRPTELRNFGLLLILLASLAAIGTIHEFRSGSNVFYDLADKLFSGFASVSPPPAPTLDSRAETFGPTSHGLAITTMLTLALPFAIIEMASARTLAKKALFALAVALIVAGAVCTQRKTAIIAPVIVIAVMSLYRPRMMFRLAPLGVALVVLVQVVAPGAISGVASQLFGDELLTSGSSVGRSSDYEAVRPDVTTHPLLGRGYGTMDPTRSDNYRILDNQDLGWVLQTGFLGLAAFLALLATAMALAHRLIRHGLDERSRMTGLAAMAGFAAFTIASLVFDLMSFVQVPYLFCLLAAFCSVAAAHGLPATRTAAAPQRVAAGVPTA